MTSDPDTSEHRMPWKVRLVVDRLGVAERMLAEIATAGDAVEVIRFAEAARVWAEQARLGRSSVNHATVIKLRAERRLADVVDEGQERRDHSQGRGWPTRKCPRFGHFHLA